MTTEILDSHIMPAWVYRHVRRGDGGPDQLPLVLANGEIRQNTKQWREHMLGRCCEDRIKVGEDYIKTIAYQRGSRSPLFDLPRFSGPQPAESIAFEASSLNSELIAHFAAGFVWRVSVATSLPLEIRLGPYDAPIRRFLLGRGPFPKEARVFIAVLIDEGGEPLHTSACLPIPSMKRGSQQYTFTIAGLVFFVTLGKRAARSDEYCLVHRPPNRRYVLATHARKIGIFRKTSELLRKIEG